MRNADLERTAYTSSEAAVDLFLQTLKTEEGQNELKSKFARMLITGEDDAEERRQAMLKALWGWLVEVFKAREREAKDDEHGRYRKYVSPLAQVAQVLRLYVQLSWGAPDTNFQIVARSLPRWRLTDKEWLEFYLALQRGIEFDDQSSPKRRQEILELWLQMTIDNWFSGEEEQLVLNWVKAHACLFGSAIICVVADGLHHRVQTLVRNGRWDIEFSQRFEKAMETLFYALASIKKSVFDINGELGSYRLIQAIKGLPDRAA